MGSRVGLLECTHTGRGWGKSAGTARSTVRTRRYGFHRFFWGFGCFFYFFFIVPWFGWQELISVFMYRYHPCFDMFVRLKSIVYLSANDGHLALLESRVTLLNPNPEPGNVLGLLIGHFLIRRFIMPSPPAESCVSLDISRSG